jgi:hypothetical protein
MRTTAQFIRPKVYSFYLRNLKAAQIPTLQNVQLYVNQSVMRTVLTDHHGKIEFDNNFNKSIQLEIYKLSEDITRWLYSQQELVKREVRRSGVKDRRLLPMVAGLDRVQARSVINTFTRSPYAADRQAAMYRRRRAGTIADTESVKWEAVGKRAVWKAARQQGYLPGWARIVWTLSKISRHCERCVLMANQPATPEGMFVTPEGYGIYSPPLHPNCRCGVRLEGGD